MEKSQFKKIEKVVVNVGVGKLSGQSNFVEKILPEISKDLADITGQKASERPARKSIATFKLRAGTIVGLQVTLRGQRMEHFLNKLNNIVIPRIRDFRGIDLKKIDENGNLSFGIKEHIVFPEIKADATNVSFGLQITLVPKQIKNNKQAVELYRAIGVPLKKDK
ncbi:MAG: 50S ribosomal protein L5 [bacterium]|nr:50S ribosomal protein L5 [bacterium]